MDILVAGLGDVGGPLALRALRTDHNVVGLDTWHEHAHRLEYLKLPLSEELPKPWQSLREWERHGMYTQLYEGDEPEPFDVAIVTPNCMINDAPHIRWLRFDREMRMIGKKLRKGNLVVLHCLSLYGEQMMHDAERLLGIASGLTASKDYCLVWTGILQGEYQAPETQDLFVSGWETNCTARATELLDSFVGSATALNDLEKTGA